METDNRGKQETKDRKSASRKIVVEATAIMILLALVLVIVGYSFLHFYFKYELQDLLSDVVGNLIGVLAAFLLFDILYNQLTQDAYSRETSQQITKTLMGDSETLDVFSDEDKKAFLVSTIRSILKDEDAVDVVVGNISKYFSDMQTTRIRKSFNYTITLTTELPNEYKCLPGCEDYYYVQENLNYEVKYFSEEQKNLNSKSVCIGFSFDKLSLDAGLMESDSDPAFAKCIFNESLDITKEAVKYLRSLSGDELKEKFNAIFTPTIKIDKAYGDLEHVEVRDGGILAEYKVDYDYRALEHAVRIIFHMPKMWGSLFEVTLVDPTKDPKITFDYMPGKMDVTMYSYLNKGDESNEGAYETRNGLYDVAIKDEWIYPKSGIVFTVKKK
ncbi:MAG: hypothetical protein IJ794_12415 [Lachnospiraceae bacterium]|nr:hypothetical protein [Lachnospiraceae bacterium]